MSAAEENSTTNLISIEDQQDNCMTDGKNPLRISLVLLEVFKNLSSEDLKNCRLVNSLWRSEATPVLIRKTVVKLLYTIDKKMHQLPPTKLARFMVEMKDFYHENFSILNLDEWFNYFGADKPLIKAFFPKFGPKMRTLKLKIYIQKVSELKIFQELGKSLPNLKQLEFQISFIQVWPIVEQFDRGFSDPTTDLTPLEKLQKLTFRACDYSIESEETMDVVSNLFVKVVPNPESLVMPNFDRLSRKVLEEYSRLDGCKITEMLITALERPNHIFEILNRWPTPLKKFDYHGKISDAIVFQNWLNKLAPTVEDLSIRFHPDSTMAELKQIIMPTFPKLIKLCIENRRAIFGSCKIEFKFNSTFKNHFPMLKMKNEELAEMFAEFQMPSSSQYAIAPIVLVVRF